MRITDNSFCVGICLSPKNGSCWLLAREGFLLNSHSVRFLSSNSKRVEPKLVFICFRIANMHVHGEKLKISNQKIFRRYCLLSSQNDRKLTLARPTSIAKAFGPERMAISLLPSESIKWAHPSQHHLNGVCLWRWQISVNLLLQKVAPCVINVT